jgi:tetratricopeptide (TPR) repeat protein
MELVRGIKITDYCDENNLSTSARLELFIQVCQAIQHAHQKGIIHRDIKPSNILVTVNDGVAVPKVIDFGIAKATQGRLTDHTLFTAFEQFLGTPAYMSPEQAVMTSLDIDTRSDIYSLGVLLYELLTSQTPFDAKELLRAGLDEIRRTIREQEPPRPSTRLSTMLGADLTLIAKHRHAEPPKLIHLLRGDLDWIVMKALEKDRTRRYETANGLAMDIQRHLGNEPVAASPPSNLYRFQKIVRRNKLVFACAAIVMAALALGFGVSTRMFLQERQARREQARLRLEAQAKEQSARTEAAKSQEVTKFLESMLDGVEPSVALGRDTTMLREILDKTAERVGKNLKDQPEVEAELRSIMGDTYGALGRNVEAEAMYRQAMAIYKKLYGEDTLSVASLLNNLASETSAQSRHAEAEALERESLAIRRKLLGNENLAVAESLAFLGIVLLREGIDAPESLKQSKFVEAETLEREALAMRIKLLGKENLDVAQSLEDLTGTVNARGNFGQSETFTRAALAIRIKLLGKENLPVAASLLFLADALHDQGKRDEAENFYNEALAMRRKLCGNDHPDVAYVLAHLAILLQEEGRLAEAEAANREALAVWRKSLGDEHPFVRGTMNFMAEILRDEGKFVEAEGLFREALNIRRKALGNEHPETIKSLNGLVDVLKREGKLSEAQELLENRPATAIKEKPEPR